MYELDTIGGLYASQPPQMAGILDDVSTLLTGGTTGGIQAAYNAATGGTDGPGPVQQAKKTAQDLASAQAQTAANIAKKGAELAAQEAKKAAAYALAQGRAEAASVKKTVVVVGLLAAAGLGAFWFLNRRKAA